MTSAFLDFSKSRSNDLSTSVPEYGFPDLKPGDRRCLCAGGWQEALKANQAPRVVLRATREWMLPGRWYMEAPFKLGNMLRAAARTVES
jgi:uncharacterized protein (DUF2237 family)